MEYKKAKMSTEGYNPPDDDTLNCYAILLDITLADFKQAIADTGLSAEEIVKKYFDQHL
jgi:hypothetical protein